MFVQFVFAFQEHFNFAAVESGQGPALLSLKSERISSQDHLRVLLRLRTGTVHELLPISCLQGESPSPSRIAKVSSDFKENYVKTLRFTLPIKEWFKYCSRNVK
jgi:hypothetical protein